MPRKPITFDKKYYGMSEAQLRARAESIAIIKQHKAENNQNDSELEDELQFIINRLNTCNNTIVSFSSDGW
jgi:hypothetical protein